MGKTCHNRHQLCHRIDAAGPSRHGMEEATAQVGSLIKIRTLTIAWSAQTRSWSVPICSKNRKHLIDSSMMQVRCSTRLEQTTMRQTSSSYYTIMTNIIILPLPLQVSIVQEISPKIFTIISSKQNDMSLCRIRCAEVAHQKWLKPTTPTSTSPHRTKVVEITVARIAKKI